MLCCVRARHREPARWQLAGWLRAARGRLEGRARAGGWRCAAGQASRRGATRRACTRCASRTTDGGGSGGGDGAPANRRWAQMRERSPAPTPPAPCPLPSAPFRGPSSASCTCSGWPARAHAPGRLLHLVLVHLVLRRARAGPAVLVPAPALALFWLRSRVLPCSARAAPVAARVARLARATTTAAAAASPAALWLRRRPAALSGGAHDSGPICTRLLVRLLTPWGRSW